MKHFLFVTILVTWFAISMYSQKTHGGGGNSMQTNPSLNNPSSQNSNGSQGSQSGTTQMQTGFHYRMKIKGHIEYKNLNDSIERYWESDKRLKVRITQVDPGILLISFLRNDFPETSTANKFTDEDGDTHEAKPICKTDVVDSFFLSIKKRVYANDQTYFRAIPYIVTQYGATTIPFVFRPSYKTKTLAAKDTTISRSSSTNLSLALYIGRKWGWTRFFYDDKRTHNAASIMASVFGGVQSLSLGQTNTFDGKSSSPIILTAGASVTIELNIVNFGLFIGHDISLGNTSNWFYNKQPIWFGFGVGLNLGMFTQTGTIGY